MLHFFLDIQNFGYEKYSIKLSSTIVLPNKSQVPFLIWAEKQVDGNIFLEY
jgi:hypothetical protein